MTDVVFLFKDIVGKISPVLNPLHRELRDLVVSMLYLLGRLEQAAAHGDLQNCVEVLELVDNLSTSLRGLCEIEYTIREKARKLASYK